MSRKRQEYLPDVPLDEALSGGSHKKPCKRRNGRVSESAESVCGVPSEETLVHETGAYELGNFSAREPDYRFRIHGKLISKKNLYTPNKRGFFKNPKIKTAEKMVELQIPSHLRDLKLESPDMIIQMYVSRLNSDRDNGYTFLLDCLVANGVLFNDNMRRCNGTHLLLPVKEADDFYTDVFIWRN